MSFCNSETDLEFSVQPLSNALAIEREMQKATTAILSESTNTVHGKVTVGMATDGKLKVVNATYE